MTAVVPAQAHTAKPSPVMTRSFQAFWLDAVLCSLCFEVEPVQLSIDLAWYGGHEFELSRQAWIAGVEPGGVVQRVRMPGVGGLVGVVPPTRQQNVLQTKTHRGIAAFGIDMAHLEVPTAATESRRLELARHVPEPHHLVEQLVQGDSLGPLTGDRPEARLGAQRGLPRKRSRAFHRILLRAQMRRMNGSGIS